MGQSFSLCMLKQYEMKQFTGSMKSKESKKSNKKVAFVDERYLCSDEPNIIRCERNDE